MLTSLIKAHLELEKELERAISDDCASQVIQTIDRKMTDLDGSIRQAVPANNDEAKAKLNFFLSRISLVGGAVVSKKDVESIEALFDHILASAGDDENIEPSSADPNLISGVKS